MSRSIRLLFLHRIWDAKRQKGLQGEAGSESLVLVRVSGNVGSSRLFVGLEININVIHLKFPFAVGIDDKIPIQAQQIFILVRLLAVSSLIHYKI